MYVERQLWAVEPHDCLLTLLHRRRSAGGKTHFLLPNHWIIRTQHIQRTSLLPITFTYQERVKHVCVTVSSTSCWHFYVSPPVALRSSYTDVLSFRCRFMSLLYCVLPLYSL